MSTGQQPELKRSLETLRYWATKVLQHPDLIDIARAHTPNASYNLAIQKGKPEKIARAARWLSMIRRDYGQEAFDAFVNEQQHL